MLVARIDPVALHIVQNTDQWFGLRLWRIRPHTIVTSSGVTEHPGEPLNLTGWTFRAAFASPKAPGQKQMVLGNSYFSTTTNLPEYVGQLWVVMHSPAALSNLVTASGEYQVIAIDTNGYDHEIARGSYTFHAAPKDN